MLAKLIAYNGSLVANRPQHNSPKTCNCTYNATSSHADSSDSWWTDSMLTDKTIISIQSPLRASAALRRQLVQDHLCAALAAGPQTCLQQSSVVS